MASVIFLPCSVTQASPFLKFNLLSAFINKHEGKLFLLLLLVKYLAQAPSFLFSILSLEMSTPKTKANFACIHFGKSPAFPHAKSIKVPP